MSLRIAVVVGSLRQGSINRKLAEALIRLPAAAGHDFAFVDIGSVPLYVQDQDADPPAPVVTLREEIRSADGVMFVTPEYNRSIPGVLKNAIDHASRPYGKSVWAGKPAGVIGTSPGKPGTAMAQQHLRNILAYLDMPTLAQPEAMIQWYDEFLSPTGEAGEKSAQFLSDWMTAFLNLVEQHKS